MEDLLEAIAIFMKYGNPRNPFNCCHDELVVCGYDPTEFHESDKKRLYELGFFIQIEGETSEDDEDEVYEETKIYSFRYGSC